MTSTKHTWKTTVSPYLQIMYVQLGVVWWRHHFDWISLHKNNIYCKLRMTAVNYRLKWNTFCVLIVHQLCMTSVLFVTGFGGSGSQVDSARMNLASSFVNGFVNAAFGQDKLLTDDGNKWLYKNKDHGKRKNTLTHTHTHTHTLANSSSCSSHMKPFYLLNFSWH